MISGLNLDVSIGALSVQRVPDLWIFTERRVPLTQIGVVLPDPKGDIFRKVKDGDPVAVTVGYRGQAPAVWEGTVRSTSDSLKSEQVVINAVGLERPLAETVVKQSFFNESPESIVKFAVEQSGLPVGQIEATGIVFPRFTASTIPVWQVAKQCEASLKRAYGMDMRPWALWMDKEGRVNWGGFDAPGNMPVVESQANLIRHCPGQGHSELSRIETFMLPHFRHSMKFRIKDPRHGVEGDFRALKVHHRFRDSQARTFISYGESYERY